jgi:hypothetical protein
MTVYQKRTVRTLVVAAIGSSLYAGADVQPEWLKQGWSQCEGGKRDMYSFSDVCNVGEEINMRPVDGFSCNHKCGAGSYLSADTTGPRETWKSACAPCPLGKYSMGGGALYTGKALVWKEPWPLEFHTECITLRNGNWRHGNCAGWQTGQLTEYGSLINSGSNDMWEGNEQLISNLYLNANFVRDGWVKFKFRVESEQCDPSDLMRCDGLVFHVDQDQRTQKYSGSTQWQEVNISVPAGSHTLKWEYSKDESVNVNEDRAYIEVVAVNGTGFADTQCAPCAYDSDHTGAGLSYLCHQCPRNHYADYSDFAYEVAHEELACRPCPANSWSAAGSGGLAACTMKFPCTQVRQ